jgi:hypothetical protein
MIKHVVMFGLTVWGLFGVIRLGRCLAASRSEDS